jgi:hypothetical protein
MSASSTCWPAICRKETSPGFIDVPKEDLTQLVSRTRWASILTPTFLGCLCRTAAARRMEVILEFWSDYGNFGNIVDKWGKSLMSLDRSSPWCMVVKGYSQVAKVTKPVSHLRQLLKLLPEGEPTGLMLIVGGLASAPFRFHKICYWTSQAQPLVWLHDAISAA